MIKNKLQPENIPIRNEKDDKSKTRTIDISCSCERECHTVVHLVKRDFFSVQKVADITWPDIRYYTTSKRVSCGPKGKQSLTRDNRVGNVVHEPIDSVAVCAYPFSSDLLPPVSRKHGLSFSCGICSDRDSCAENCVKQHYRMQNFW